MGCDIHAHIEIKLNGKWEHYSIPRICRNYELFEKLAGVRGEESNAISPPRGLPDDVTVVTKLDCDRWEGDGHSHSWVSSGEFADVYRFHCSLPGCDDTHLSPDTYGFLFGNGFDTFHEFPDDYPPEVEDFRMVFWFDN